jgi:hypothetical protein
MAPWRWDEGRKKIFFLSMIFYEQNYFYLSTLLNSNKKTSSVNIDLKKNITLLKQSENFNWSRFR